MAQQRAHLTQAGYERLQQELEELKRRRQAVREEVAATRADGDLRENAPYHMARQQYGILEGRITELQRRLDEAVIVAEDANFEEVVPGVPVRVRNEATGVEEVLTIVDQTELKTVRNGVSVHSPIAEALLYLMVGDTGEAETPKGIVRYTILNIGDGG